MEALLDVVAAPEVAIKDVRVHVMPVAKAVAVVVVAALHVVAAVMGTAIPHVVVHATVFAKALAGPTLRKDVRVVRALVPVDRHVLEHVPDIAIRHRNN